MHGGDGVLLEAFLFFRECSRTAGVRAYPLTELCRRVTDLTGEKACEIMRIVIAERDRDLLYGKLRAAEQLYCVRDLVLGDILERRYTDVLFEQTYEMLRRKVTVFGDGIR